MQQIAVSIASKLLFFYLKTTIKFGLIYSLTTKITYEEKLFLFDPHDLYDHYLCCRRSCQQSFR